MILLAAVAGFVSWESAAFVYIAGFARVEAGVYLNIGVLEVFAAGR